MTDQGNQQRKDHIRPRVRASQGNAAKEKITKPKDSDAALDDSRLHKWLRVPEATPATVSRESEVLTSKTSDRPVGILRKPKYTKSAPPPNIEDEFTVKEPESNDLTEIEENQTDNTLAVKDLVLERDPSQMKSDMSPFSVPPEHDHRAVEGYAPKSESDEPIVLSSVSDLLEKAGMLPDQNDKKPLMIEAKLEFSVMSAQEFEEYQKELQNDESSDQPAEVFQGHFEVFSDDETEEDEFDFLHLRDGDSEEYWSEYDDDDEERPAPKPRPFIVLWEALSGWITPEAVDLVKQWREGKSIESSPDWVQIVDTSEIAASRCAGVMAMVNMSLPKCINELNRPTDRERALKHRLVDLLRSFHFSRPTPKLDTVMWRAMTCLLLIMVLGLGIEDGESENIPVSLMAVGLSAEEYKYLASSIFSSLETGSS
jgi:hypothetical protein